ncbi:MAG TPA: hypothetical protein VN922_14315 [Bacteroidia bacterium]|nr:hypothetical protein [Bacteroidia bacterium]
MRSYTVYFYPYKSSSCMLYFGVDGNNKKEVLKLGRGMAKLWADHCNSLGFPTKLKIKVVVEKYISNLKKNNQS